MKAVVFAAGLGTRLGVLTQSRPKALVELGGRPMLYRVMDRLREAGADSFLVNVHAFAGLVEQALDRYAEMHPEISISVSDERDCLLETGGGLKKMAAQLGDDPFLVHNVDILCDMDLRGFAENSLQLIRETESLAVLAVRRTESDRYFLFDPQGKLCGWENVRTGQQKISRPEVPELDRVRMGFMGIHCIHPRLLSLMVEEGAFSITDVYLRLASSYSITMMDESRCSWTDIGSPEQLAKAEEEIKNTKKI